MGARDARRSGARIEEILETTRLTEQRDRRAGDLSHGQKQWLEIGMLLAQEPQLLLVDEPVAGMTDAETEQTAELLREINRTRSVVVVEHDMAFVRALGVKVTVLHEGSVLSEGSIDHVSEDPRSSKCIWGADAACLRSTWAGAASIPSPPAAAAAEPTNTNGSSRRAACQLGVAVSASSTAV